MQLENIFTARFLVQTVNILCDDCPELALVLKLGEL